ncbi:MAG: hypothetical protein ACOC1F_09065, partial [Myxococcota bacterium]
MKRVKKIRHIEDCLDSSVVKELELHEPIDEPLMRAMARDASLDYHPEFPRPYYRITRTSFWVIQGVVGNTTCRVTFSPSRPPGAERELLWILEGAGSALAYGRGDPSSTDQKTNNHQKQ